MMGNSVESLQDRFNYALKTTGRTQAYVSKISGVSTGYVSNICSGKTKNPGKNIDKLARALGVNAEWLRTGVGHPQLSEVEYVSINYYKNLLKQQEKIKIPALWGTHESKYLEAYNIYPCETFEGEVMIIVNKKGRGSGMFLICSDSRLIVSMRQDELNSLEWFFFSSEQIDIKGINVIGKIVSIFTDIKETKHFFLS